MAKQNLFVKLEREKIGRQVRERRNQIGLSLQDLSDSLSMRKATINNIELGRNVNIDTLLTVVMYLRGQVNIFFKK